MNKKLPTLITMNPIIIDKNCFISLNSTKHCEHISNNSLLTPNSALIGGKFKPNNNKQAPY
jgi:hypothetical protein